MGGGAHGMWERLKLTVKIGSNSRTRKVAYARNVRGRNLVLLLAISCFGAIHALSVQARAADRPLKGQSIVGTVKDALGRPLADVRLVLQARDGHIVARTRSGQNGAFEFRNIPHGTYAIAANKGAFRTGVTIVAVPSPGAANLDIALQAETALSLAVVATRINAQPNG